jgi:hypothetical protein
VVWDFWLGSWGIFEVGLDGLRLWGSSCDVDGWDFFGVERCGVLRVEAWMGGV